MKKEKLSQKSWFVILWLVFFFPVGLFLMWKNKKFNKATRFGVTALLLVIFIFYTSDNSDKQSLTNNSIQVASESTSQTNEALDNEDSQQNNKVSKEETVKQDTIIEESEVQTSNNSDISTTYEFNGKVYTIIEVDGGDLSGDRQPNVAVNIGYGDREYWSLTNEYGQLEYVIADKIILQDDSTEPVNSDGRYYNDEAKVPGTEQSDLDEGHVIADSLGGVSNAYNITPQNSTLNRHGDQAYMEKVIRDADGCENFLATITYPDTTTQIPSKYKYEYVLKGNDIIDEFDNVNPDEVNNTNSNTVAKQEDSNTANSQDTSAVNEQEELARIDTNGNGKVTIAEAKAAGFSMPIYSDHWLYKYMDDRDGDGMVGE